MVFTIQNGTYKHTAGADVYGTAIEGTKDMTQTPYKGCTIIIKENATVQAAYNAILADGSTVVEVYGKIESGNVAVYGLGPTNKVTISGAEITAGGIAIRQDAYDETASKDLAPSTFIITDSKIQAPGNMAVYIASNEGVASGKHTLTVTDSEISGEHGIVVMGTDATISGEDTKVNAPNGHALAIANNGEGQQSVGTMTINGGTFIGQIGTLAPVADDTAITMGIGGYLVTVDSDNGDPLKSEVVTNGSFELPTAPEKSGYTFSGWKSSADDSVKGAGTSVAITDTTTFTAQWTAVYTGGGGGSSTTYYSTTVEQTENGSLSVSPTRASKGRTVTITVKPDEGYELDTLTVTEKDGTAVEITRTADNKYTFTMPASQVTIEATFQESVSPVDSFVDVDENAWYYQAVQYMVENGLMSGTSTTTFSPNTTLSRGMIAQMLYALEGKPSTQGSSFTDVASGAWYADAAAWAQANQVITGYDNGAFGPDDPLTREQLTLILYNYARLKGYEVSAKGDLSAFVDGHTTSSWAQESMTWAVGAGLLSGKGLGMLYPTGTATRAEVAQIMMNFCESVAK